MKRVNINGTIMAEHWFNENEVTEKDVVNQLSAVLPGEETEIIINSCGGEVVTAIAIFNHIREFAKTHPCTVIMQGIVGSAASFIALAAKCGNSNSKIKAYDNSIFFIHNVQGFASGDWRKMEKMRDLFKSMTDLIINSAYAKVSSDSVKEIEKAMDAETYYFGAAIKEHGYADIIESDAENENGIENKNVLIAEAKAKYQNCLTHINNWRNENEENRKMVAKLENSFAEKIVNQCQAVKNPAKMEDKMDVAELKAKFPEVYNAVYTAGVNEERSRVSAHLKMASDSGDVSAAVDFIANGTAVSENEVTAKYHEVFCKTQLKNARIDDNTQPITTPVTNATDEHAEAMALYKKAMLGGK